MGDTVESLSDGEKNCIHWSALPHLVTSLQSVTLGNPAFPFVNTF